MIFISSLGYVPPFTCQKINETDELAVLHLQNDSSAFMSYKPCHIEVLTNRSGFVQTVDELSCPSGRDFGGAGRKTSIVTEWDLVCEDTGIAEFVSVSFTLGQVIGGLVVSVMADKFGRKLVFVLSAILVFTLEILCVCSPNIFMMIGIRFLNGVLQDGVHTTGFVMTMELLQPKLRNIYGLVVCVSWTFWTLIIGLLAFVTQDYGWRYFQLATALMGACFPLYIICWKESPRWLAANGKTQEALTVLKTASRLNKVDFAKVKAKYMGVMLEQKKLLTNNSVNGIQFKETKHCFRKLFCKKRMIIIIVVLTFIWLTHDLIYLGMYMTSSTLSGNRFVNHALMACMEIPSTAVLFFLMPRMGRRKILSTFLILASVSLFVCSMLASFGRSLLMYGPLSVVFYLVSKFAITTSYDVIYIYTPELFPTKVRTTGYTVCLSISKIGSILAPYMRPFEEVATWGPPVTFCGMAMVSIMLTPLLPEMKNEPLNETFHKRSTKNNRKETPGL